MSLLHRRREKREQPAHDEAMRTGLMPDPYVGLWVWSGRGWYHGPDTAERRARAVPVEPCPHVVTRPDPVLGVLCLGCGRAPEVTSA